MTESTHPTILPPASPPSYCNDFDVKDSAAGPDRSVPIGQQRRQPSTEPASGADCGRLETMGVV